MDRIANPTFEQYIGIDYLCAGAPNASLKGLRVYPASSGSPPDEVKPPPSLRKYWIRRGIAEWLLELISKKV